MLKFGSKCPTLSLSPLSVNLIIYFLGEGEYHFLKIGRKTNFALPYKCQCNLPFLNHRSIGGY
jgi:hypothetical protein